MSKYYAGIGSRKAPQEALDTLKSYGSQLCSKEYILRSGRCEGPDIFFELGCNQYCDKNNIDKYSMKEIFEEDGENRQWATDCLLSVMPTDRSNFDSWRPYVKSLLRRNMMQVLGEDGQTPVDFVLCWAPSLEYSDSSSGGTGWAIRLALKHGIPVYNILDKEQQKTFEKEYGVKDMTRYL